MNKEQYEKIIEMSERVETSQDPLHKSVTVWFSTSDEMEKFRQWMNKVGIDLFCASYFEGKDNE